MKCIICQKEKTDPTEEHIVPKGIGGSLVTYRVCKECNDKLSKVDSELVNDWFIEIRNFIHEIKGRKNQVKDPLGVGTLKNDPERNVIFGPDKNGKPSIKISPKIEIKNDKIIVNVDPKEEFENIKRMVNKKLKRAGLDTLTEEQTKNLKLKLEGKSTTNGSLEVIVSKKILEYPPYRAFVKIAYELGFYFLGEDYLNDKTGETLRNFILDFDPIEKVLSKYKIFGDIELIDPDSKIEKRFKTLNNNTNLHLLAIFKNKYIVAVYIRLYSTYEGVIIISRTPDQYDNFKESGKFILMDAKNSDFSICDAKNEDLDFITEKFPLK